MLAILTPPLMALIGEIFLTGWARLPYKVAAEETKSVGNFHYLRENSLTHRINETLDEGAICFGRHSAMLSIAIVRATL
jgi:hypothetical protein